MPLLLSHAAEAVRSVEVNRNSLAAALLQAKPMTNQA